MMVCHGILMLMMVSWYIWYVDDGISWYIIAWYIVIWYIVDRSKKI
jgi:hypothetical protein